MTKPTVDQLAQQIAALEKTVQTLQGKVSTAYCVIAMLMRECQFKPNVAPHMTREAVEKLAAKQGDRFSSMNLKTLDEWAKNLP